MRPSVVPSAVDMLDGVRSYYRGVLELLRFVEARSGGARRFGAEADVHWKAFAGDLTVADRIDLLVRDADAQWPGSVGARSVYALPAVSEQDAFGADWLALDSVSATDLWREVIAAEGPEPATTPTEALQRMAKAWDLPLSTAQIPALGAADKYVVAGPSAIAAMIAAFAKRSDLDWAAQVIAVASAAAHRQLAAAACALLNLTRPVRLLTADETSEVIPGARLVISSDATEQDKQRAAALVGS